MRSAGKHYSPVSKFMDAIDPSRTSISVSDPTQCQVNESAGAKWEQLQYYESNQWQQDPAGFSSLASSSSSSTSSGVSSRCSTDSDIRSKSKFQQMKERSLKKLSNIKFQIATITSGKQRSEHAQTNVADPHGISTMPDGTAKPSGMIPRIRASKSMQNLEQITRDSYYNLRDVRSNLKQKYNSRLELRQAQPSAQYGELWDEDDDRNNDDDDGEALGGHTYENLRKVNQRRKYLELVGF